MVNRVLLVGRLCNDPELKYTPSGVAVANFRVAVDRPFTNAQGEREADFIDTVAWRQNAEFSANYLGKGRLVCIEGRIQVRSWTTQDGQRRRAMEVVADAVRALDRPRDRETAGATSGAARETAAVSGQAAETPAETADAERTGGQSDVDEAPAFDPFGDQ
jgi:single-strand DNA-binding protein